MYGYKSLTCKKYHLIPEKDYKDKIKKEKKDNKWGIYFHPSFDFSSARKLLVIVIDGGKK
jgi:hypothetical protein